MKFRAGDIIEGWEGGEGWGVTTTILLVYVESKNHVLAVVLKQVRDGEAESNRHGDAHCWTLECRDWKKIGCIEELAAVENAVLKEIGAYAPLT